MPPPRKLNDDDKPEDRAGPSRPPPAVAEDASPCNHIKSGRNLVVCIDGTGNQFGRKNTNVIEMYNLIIKANDKNQKTWYNSGIGTYAPPSWKSFAHWKQVVSHTIDMAIAWEFERTLISAYEWLSDNYEEGDMIFLFGFSRGAYQVRGLSGMLDKVGLILPGNKEQIPFAFNLYADPATSQPEENVTKVGDKKGGDGISMANRFKSVFSRDVKAHFVGVWDTVSSIGLALLGHTTLPGTVDGMKHVCYFRQALALDERRVKFLPEYAYGGTATKVAAEGTSEPGTTALGAKPTVKGNGGKSNKRPQTMEVWFAGTHSDIGGGNVENTGMDRSRPPLRWMVLEARAAGLRTASFPRELEPEEQIEIKESLTFWWHLLEWLFFLRLTYLWQGTGSETTYWPHRGGQRRIHEGQKIHSSLILASRNKKDPYTPKAILPPNYSSNGAFWERLFEARHEGIARLDKELGNWLEVDLMVIAGDLVEKFVGNDSSSLEFIHPFLATDDGVQAVYDKLCDDLNNTLILESKHYLLSWGGKFFKKYSLPENLRSFHHMKPPLSDLLADEIFKAAAKAFLLDYTYTSLIFRGHTKAVSSVAFSADGKRVVSGSYDKNIHVWDASTGQTVAGPFYGHKSDVNSVAFSPDGQRVVSGSDDKRVRIWDLATGKTVVGPLKGHTNYVCAVAFSPDGKRVVSGSADETIRTWDALTGTMVAGPFTGHTGWVMSVAFSPDGKYVVSGGNDESLRVWDEVTRETVVGPIEGHAGGINSVAFSPDGKRVVSGSDDKTVCIWDAATGEMMAGPFEGHSSGVCSVAFSPDGQRVVSGSLDKTLRICHAATGEMVVGPFEGHTGGIISVAFSPDGKHVVSASVDKTIRIWDAATGKICHATLSES